MPILIFVIKNGPKTLFAPPSKKLSREKFIFVASTNRFHLRHIRYSSAVMYTVNILTSFRWKWTKRKWNASRQGHIRQFSSEEKPFVSHTFGVWLFKRSSRDWWMPPESKWLDAQMTLFTSDLIVSLWTRNFYKSAIWFRMRFGLQHAWNDAEWTVASHVFSWHLFVNGNGHNSAFIGDRNVFLKSNDACKWYDRFISCYLIEMSQVLRWQFWWDWTSLHTILLDVIELKWQFRGNTSIMAVLLPQCR